MKKLLLLLPLFTLFSHAENNIAVNINNEDVELSGAYNLNSTLGYDSSVNTFIELSYLHNTNDTNDLFTLGFNGENSLEAAPGLIFGLGFKLAYAKDFMAVPLLGKLRYILPFDSDIPTTSLFTSYAYAPSALTFFDGENYSEFKLEADVELITNIHIFTGYRNIDTDYLDVGYKLNDSFYAGLKVAF